MENLLKYCLPASLRPSATEKKADEVLVGARKNLERIKGASFFYEKEGHYPFMPVDKQNTESWTKLDKNTDWYARFATIPKEFALDTDRWNILFSYAVEGADLKIHTHPQVERIWVLQGSLLEVVSSKKAMPGTKVFEVPGNARHGWHALEDTFFVVQYVPPMGIQIDPAPKDDPIGNI